MTTLNDLLEEYHVDFVDDYHNEVNNGKLTGILGWYSVSNNDGVIAYFSEEAQAHLFRRSIIDDRLNGGI